MKKTLVWFRQDLRIQDNPALLQGVKEGEILCVYIYDTTHFESWDYGGASKVWLHHSLKNLSAALDENLILLSGDPKTIIPELVQKNALEQVYWNRCYEPFAMARDKEIKADLKQKGIETKSFNGSLLWEPWEISKNDGTPYKVFTPFYRKGCLQFGPPRPVQETPETINFVKTDTSSSKLNELELLPNELSWPDEIVKDWDISEQGAHNRLELFLNEGLSSYKDGRNLPAKPFVSRLSPYLRFGLISPHQIWQAVEDYTLEYGSDKNSDHFKSELGWREFSYSLLYFNPDLPSKPIQNKFQAFPWKSDPSKLKAWQTGQTGCPIVDAGMRELYQTGFMHNRVRMIVGSYLVKNLLIHWQEGEKWFWDCLFDADLANNSASWQWIAGCGADAAPYFRIFNPITQSEKFDADGEYIRQYVPELARLPNKFLYAPWTAPELVLKEAGVELGGNYPKPIIDLKHSREEALEAFSSLKQAS